MAGASTACAGLSGTLVLYIAAQFVTWAIHDGLQQWMFEQPGFERFGVTMALCLQTTCVLGALAEAALSSAAAPRGRDAAAPAPAPSAEAPPEAARADAAAPPPGASRGLRLLSMPASYALLGLMIALSAALANGSLAFVSQPVKVLFKSSKLLPVMFFRALLGNAGANSWSDYGYAAALALGLTLFSAGDAAGELAGKDALERGAALRSQAAGIVMLLGSVSCDAVAPNLQERLLRRFAQPKRAVVLHTNWLSAALTAAVWLPSGEARAAVAYLRTHPRPARVLALQSLAGYAGVLSYLGCIRYAGSKATVLVTTARKMFTIALSFCLFSASPFTLQHAVGLTIAVAGMTGSAVRETTTQQRGTAAAAAAAGAEGAARKRRESGIVLSDVEVAVALGSGGAKPPQSPSMSRLASEHGGGPRGFGRLDRGGAAGHGVGAPLSKLGPSQQPGGAGASNAHNGRGLAALEEGLLLERSASGDAIADLVLAHTPRPGAHGWRGRGFGFGGGAADDATHLGASPPPSPAGERTTPQRGRDTPPGEAGAGGGASLALRMLRRGNGGGT